MLVLCASLAPSQPAQAHDDDVRLAPPPAMPAAVLCQPTAMPDRIVLTWTDDPTRTQAVTWRTSTDVSRAFAEIAVATGGPDLRKQARRIEATTRVFVSDLSKCCVHSLVFRDLTPATKYAYRVGDGVNWSEWFQFRTAAADPEPFSFVYFGDAQNEVRSMWSRVVREAFCDAPRAAFTLHAGDLIDVAERDGDWGEWFAAGAWINAMIPVVAVPGNHEYASRKEADGTRTRWLSHHWRVQFAFPANGPEELRNTVYYLDYQNLRLIALNSNERHEEQVAWLDAVLTDNPQTWTVVTFHHPIFSTAEGRDNPTLRELWKPVFDRHRVDLVLNGHDHTYGRTASVGSETNAASGINWRSEAGGTVYVVSVSGPKMYKLTSNPQADFQCRAENTQLYQIISIDGPELRFEARTATGDSYDSFVLDKRGERNKSEP